MKAMPSLPMGYEIYERVDLARDKKTFVKLNILSVLLFIATVAVAIPTRRHSFNQYEFNTVWEAVLPWIAMIIGIVVYIFLHEGVHGFFIRQFTGKGAGFGFKLKSGMAYASSDWFFPKKQYIIIAFAPIIVWGIVLFILCKEAPSQYFWFIYTIQAVNVSGAAGDIYIAWRVLRMPADILVHDEGTAMDFYAPGVHSM